LNIDKKFREAIQSFWTARKKNLKKQKSQGKQDAGTRGAVTAGNQLAVLEKLIVDILIESGLNSADIKTRSGLELPGFFRTEKKWDIVVVSNGQLVLAIEFKSMVGSFGNNLNNRSEEVVGSASCIWTAYREGRFGRFPPPFLGYFFLLEDHQKVHNPKYYNEPHFAVDPIFKTETTIPNGKSVGVSYAKRFEIVCRRLVLERLYNATCLVLATNESPTRITQPADDLCFQRFVASIRGHVRAFLEGRKANG
jgi:hypothetical protein